MTDTDTGFALYRLPHGDVFTLVEGGTEELRACPELNGRQGFVVAPFCATEQEPTVLIRPDKVSVWPSAAHDGQVPALHLPAFAAEPQPGRQPRQADRTAYAIDFASFHSHLNSGEFRKIVLARCAVEPCREDLSPLALFLSACRSYPRLFIALVYTRQSGLWLTATPEILLEGVAGKWRTIALAGTMKLTPEQLADDVPAVAWSDKNIQEQRYVATYITECLEQFTNDFTEEGPRTARAANLVHLRSDFVFTLPDEQRLGDLLHALHPTPAVCGLPKRQTFQFIIRNEHTPRRYYSGFMGPLCLSSAEAPQPGTHLFVSLRCMNIAGRICHLYAGGGLLCDSKEEQEWQETEAKLETMRNLLTHR